MKHGADALSSFPCAAAAAAAAAAAKDEAESPSSETAAAAPSQASESLALALSRLRVEEQIPRNDVPQQPLCDHVFAVDDAGDHAETPIEAYLHIKPLLTRLSRCLSPHHIHRVHF